MKKLESVVRKIKKLETHYDIWNELRPYVYSWIPMKFLRQVIWACDNDHITHVELDITQILTRGTTSDYWNHILYLKLAEPKDAMFVINNLAMHAAATEVSMEDETTLRLCWD